ncbi:CDK5 domain-containing protein [Flexibacterium corallicola]|uniref:CDK5 domain-containing protein n=1 Tax=Flexibacterium corallicola TaxID=3037259 RepID=UPI00286EFEA1|nr:CDK5 domain-containing protein [Pseudovibrio sp. M1P-2-3]
MNAKGDQPATAEDVDRNQAAAALQKTAQAAQKQIDETTQEFLNLKQQIPDFKKVIAEIKQQQSDLDKASTEVAQAAHQTMTKVEQSVKQISADVQREVSTLTSSLSGFSNPPQTNTQATQANAAQHPPNSPTYSGSVTPQQVADALRKVIQSEVNSVINSSLAPLTSQLKSIIENKENK